MRTRATSLTTQTFTAIGTSDSAVLELTKVIKASQAFFEEIYLAPLLSTVLQVMMENAGADKGALLLLEADNLVIAAQCISGQQCNLQPIPIESSSKLPITAINYVWHTQQTLVSNEVTAETFLATDSYIIGTQPQSWLCLPMIHQSKLIGILYLENQLRAGIFTSNRLKILKLLCAQAAIALKNARLYQQLEAYSETLEQKVQERTHQLQQEIREREEVDSALCLSEEKFAKAFLCSPNAITITSLSDGKHLEVNDSFCSFTGYSPEEILGNTAKELNLWVNAEDRDRLFNAIQDTKVIRNYEFDFRTKSGAVRTALLSAEIITLHGQQCLLSLSNDITERQQASKSLAQLNLALANAMPGIAKLSTEGRYVEVNDSYAKIAGYEPEEMIGVQWHESIYPEDLPIAIAAYERMLVEGKAEFEARGVRQDGSIFYKQVLVVKADLNRAGFEGHYCFYKDISDTYQRAEQRRQTEAALERQNQQLQQEISERQRIEAMLDGQNRILELIAKGNPLSQILDNLAHFIEQLSGEALCSFLLLESNTGKLRHGAAPSLPDSYNQAVDGIVIGPKVGSCGTAAYLKKTVIVSDIATNYLWEDFKNLPLQYGLRACWSTPVISGEEVLGTFAMYYHQPKTPSPETQKLIDKATHLARIAIEHDRTTQALQQAKEAADAANRAKSQFLTNMSHELRTPLNGILGYTQLFQRSAELTPQQQKGINTIHTCGTHLLTLINDILDLSKIEVEKMELYPHDFHFPNFLWGVTQMCQIRAQQKGITFAYEPSNQLPTAVHTDEKRLRQVLINLLGNAIKFTDSGGVTFKVSVISYSSLVIGEEQRTNNQQPTTNHKIRFEVEDTGIGIATEELEKIFEPFEQMGDNQHKSEGTGLGLAITKKIVSLMGSQLQVETTLGDGSSFWFELELPQASEAIELRTLSSFREIIGYQGDRKKIIVVDDYDENRLVFVKLLEPLGFEIREASNAEEALEQGIKFRPDLMIIDLVMPGMDGFELTQYLRQLPEFQRTILIASSASVSEFYQIQSKEVGCNDFLAKPIQAEDLLFKIRDYLELTWVYKYDDKLPIQPTVALTNSSPP
ncbi:MAG: PAS domain S-box protein [Symploca sp. SIO2C1]|nr:PAS domain S-box protein [Symploca sp. SIO2C1]